MREGYYIGLGDKTTCGGTVLDGDPRVNIYGLLHACEGDQVTCGKHKGIYKILGGISPIESHGRRMAGTLDSFSSCPCRAKFIPSVYTATYSNEGYEAPATRRAVEPASSTLTGRPDTPQQSTYAPSHTLAPS
ncbi:PAAR domain-containing protein, partial [Pseudomonas sp. EYE_354]|uniref:PAAR domain-containing protein n=1 Tax=Pseudomonas sp. EYE_354 TaxID=2853449 RepID=UPI00200589DA